MDWNQIFDNFVFRPFLFQIFHGLALKEYNISTSYDPSTYKTSKLVAKFILGDPR